MSIDRLMVFLLLNGKNWRCHIWKAFKFEDGCWQEKERMELPALDLLTATEGLFISLSGIPSLDWDWKIVQREFGEIFDSSNDSDAMLKCLWNKAKLSGDYLKQLTNNKIYIYI